MTAPVLEPVTTDEVKAQCRVTGSADDWLIAGMVKAVRQSLEGRDGWLGLALVTQTWDYKLNEFPAGSIDLPLPPLASVISVAYRDEDGAPQTFSSGSYTVTGVGLPGGGAIALAEGESWPATDGTAECVTVRFVAGLAQADVPEAIKLGIKLLVEDQYDRPEGDLLRRRAMDLLRPYRAVTFA